jgi:CRP-like cAMP-binding protein
MELSAFGDHPFVRTLSPEQVDRLASCARDARFRRGEFIFREGGAADTVYLLNRGCVALEQQVPGRGAVTVESLCAGDILGLSWLFPGSSWMADARCLEPVETFALDVACLHERMDDDQALARQILTQLVRALYQRLERVRLQRLDVYKVEG